MVCWVEGECVGVVRAGKVKSRKPKAGRTQQMTEVRPQIRGRELVEMQVNEVGVNVDQNGCKIVSSLSLVV